MERRLTYSRHLADAQRPWRWQPQPRSRTVVIAGQETRAVTRAGVTTVRKIAEWPEPKTNAELQKFIDAMKRFQHWIPDFRGAAAPLARIAGREWSTPEERRAFWGPEHTSAFRALRAAILGGPSSEALRSSMQLFVGLSAGAGEKTESSADGESLGGSGGGDGDAAAGHGFSSPTACFPAEGATVVVVGAVGAEGGGGGKDGGSGVGGGGGASSAEEELSRLALWPEPSSTAKLQKFITLTKRYAHWISDYPTLAAPLVELLHVRWAAKGKADVWSAEHAAAFKAVKAAPMRAAPPALHDLAAWPEPETPEEVKSFLEAAYEHAALVPDIEYFAGPLAVTLVRDWDGAGGKGEVWGERERRAYNGLRSAPLRAAPGAMARLARDAAAEPHTAARLRALLSAAAPFRRWMRGFEELAGPLEQLHARWVAAGAAGSQSARKAAVWTPTAARHFQAFVAELAAAPEALRRVADWPEPSSANEVDAFLDAAAKYAPVIDEHAADALAALERVSSAGYGEAWEPEGKARVWRAETHGAAFDTLRETIGSALADLRAFAAWREPRSAAETSAFLERARRYAHGVANFGAVSAPLVAAVARTWGPDERAHNWGLRQARAFAVLR